MLQSGARETVKTVFHRSKLEAWRTQEIAISGFSPPATLRVIVGLMLLAGFSATAQATFQYVELDGSFYAYERDVGDVDGDGDQDVVAIQEGDTTIQVFRAPDWTRSTLVAFTGTYRYPRADDFKVADIDGDGDLDLVTGLGAFPTDNTIQAVWCENLGHGGGFSTHVIGNPSGYVKDIVVVDLDRDGRRDVVMRLDSQTQVWLQESNGSWTEVVLNHPAHEGLEAGDVDMDGDPDLILNGFWLATPDSPAAARVAANYAQRIIDGLWFNQGGDWTADSCKVVVGDFDGDGTNDVAFSHSERAGYDVAWYRSANANGAGPWVKRAVTRVDYCHNLQAADFDLDGKVDLLVGGMVQSAQRGLQLMRNQGGGLNWTPVVIQSNGSYSAELGDIDKDGDLDIVGIYNWDSGPTWIYRNTAAGGPPSLDSWSYHQVSAAHVRTFSLCFPDANGDGSRDIAAGPFVYLNPGPPLTGAWTQVPLPDNVHAFATLDVDGDNLADLIAQQDNPGAGRIDLFWVEAANAAGTAWSVPVRIGDVPRGSEPEGFQGYTVAQLVADGRPEIVVNSPQGLYYFSVPASNPEAGSWLRTFVAANNSEEGIGVADIDGDGDLDVSFTHGNPHEVKWARNPGDGSGDWTVFTIGEFPEALWPDRCAAADLNGDGRVDIVVTEENYLQPPTRDNLACWWEQPASGATNANWVRHTITTQYTMNNLDIGDLDRDGDVDLVLAEHRGDKRMAVWANDGAGHFTEHRVDAGKESHLGGRLVDLDRDGDLDLVSIAYDSFNQLHLWRNDSRSAVRPEIERVSTRGATTVQVVFSKALDKTSAQLPGNYGINKGVTVVWALLGSDNRTVTLITSPMPSGSYTVTVNNVTDQQNPPNSIGPDSQAPFNFASPLTGITFDSVAAVSDADGNSSASLNFAHGSLTNGYIVVSVSMWDPIRSTAIAGALYDGRPMTLVGSAESASAYAEVYLFGLAVGEKPAGNYPVTLTGSANVEQIVFGVTSLSGVHQAAPTGSFASATGAFRPLVGASRSPFVSVGSATGDLVVDILGHDDGRSTLGPGQISSWRIEDDSDLTDGVASRKSATGTTTAMSHVLNFPGVEWALGSVALKRAGPLSVDSASPTVVITSPPDRTRLANPVVALRGLSSDARGVAVVEYRLENAGGIGNYQAAEGTTAWSASIPGLLAGSNTIRVRARDFSGNFSPAVARTFTYVVLSPFSLSVNGPGAVSPNRNGQSLEIGRSYTMTALPAFRHVFAGWSGGLSSPSAVLPFVMQSNLTAQANFVTNPFVVLKGTYQGLFQEHDQVRDHDRSGFFALTLTERGTYSARVMLGSRSLAASGQFDWLGRSRLTLRPAISNVVTVEMQLDVTNLTFWVSGIVGDGTWQAELAGYRAPTYVGTNASPLAGRYTLAIPGQEESAQGPTGHGYSLINVGRTGLLVCSARLPDGTAFSQVVPVSDNESFPFYAWLYGGKGSIAGWITFADEVESDLEGTLSWIKRPMTTSRYYPLGFTNETEAAGSRYVYRGITQPALNFSNGSVEFSFGNLIQPFANQVLLAGNSRVTNLSSNRLTLYISLTTGEFTGTAFPPDLGRSVAFRGVALQKQNEGVGYFLGTNHSGRVVFEPEP